MITWILNSSPTVGTGQILITQTGGKYFWKYRHSECFIKFYFKFKFVMIVPFDILCISFLYRILPPQLPPPPRCLFLSGEHNSLHLLCFLRSASPSSRGQLHPFSQTKVNLHNNEPYKGGMTSSVSGPKLFCTTFTFHCSDDRAGMWRLIPCGVGGWAGPAGCWTNFCTPL